MAGGPNGLAAGPDGCLILCNNGRAFTPVDLGGVIVPGPFDQERYHGGLIQRLDADGSVHDLYTNCAGRPLRAPNDLVLDAHGGFYFTDHGIVDGHARTSDLSSIYYARCDGSDIHEVAFPAASPNGIGLSPDGETLYYAETFTGRIFRRRVVEPGVLADASRVRRVDAAVLAPGPAVPRLARRRRRGLGVRRNAAPGRDHVRVPGRPVGRGDQPPTTRSPRTCASAAPELRTAYVTLSGTGRVVTLDWPRPGLRLAHQ